METITLETELPDNPEFINAINTLFMRGHEKFDSFEKLVNNIVAIFLSYTAMLKGLSDSFATGKKVFKINVQDSGPISFSRHQTLINPKCLKGYLTPTDLLGFIIIWKQAHGEEPCDLKPLINELSAYETAWMVFADALITASNGSLSSIKLFDAVREMLLEFHLVITANKENDHLSLWLHSIEKVKYLLKEIAATIVQIDIAEERTEKKTVTAKPYAKKATD